MAQIVDRAFLLIDGTDFECKSIDPNWEMDGHEVVRVMNRRNRSAGHKSGTPTFDMTVEIPLPVGGHALNFTQMMLARQEFAVVIEYQDGASFTVVDCQIKKVGQTSTSGDDTTTTLDISGIDIGIS